MDYRFFTLDDQKAYLESQARALEEQHYVRTLQVKSATTDAERDGAAGELEKVVEQHATVGVELANVDAEIAKRPKPPKELHGA